MRLAGGGRTGKVVLVDGIHDLGGMQGFGPVVSATVVPPLMSQVCTSRSPVGQSEAASK